jgi:hypothetical protein
MGCEMHRWLVRRGWASDDAGFEVCADDRCKI